MCLATTPARSGPEASAGQKLDSGLGALPHYSKWADPSGRQPLSARLLGESLDDGLGTLPPYAQWLDKTGKDPMGRQRPTVAGP